MYTEPEGKEPEWTHSVSLHQVKEYDISHSARTLQNESATRVGECVLLESITYVSYVEI